MRLGKQVLELLKQKNHTKAELARYLNTQPSTITGWIQNNRNPSSEMILPICEFLQVTPTYLFTGNNDLNLSSEDLELLNLYHQLDFAERKECLGFVRGYLAHSVNENNKNSDSEEI